MSLRCLSLAAAGLVLGLAVAAVARRARRAFGP